MMTDERYAELQTNYMMLASLLLSQDESELNQFLERARLAETVGPVVDPTLYLRGMDRLSFVIEAVHVLSQARAQIMQAKERHVPELDFQR